MNNMTCSFDDEQHLHQHIVNEVSGERVSFFTLSQARIRVFEQVSVRLKVDNVNATNQVRGRIIRRKPMGQHPETNFPMWQYTVRLDADDKVWFEAFIDEVETRSKFYSMSA